MTVLGAWRFLMSEVPPYMAAVLALMLVFSQEPRRPPQDHVVVRIGCRDVRRSPKEECTMGPQDLAPSACMQG